MTVNFVVPFLTSKTTTPGASSFECVPAISAPAFAMADSTSLELTSANGFPPIVGPVGLTDFSASKANDVVTFTSPLSGVGKRMKYPDGDRRSGLLEIVHLRRGAD